MKTLKMEEVHGTRYETFKDLAMRLRISSKDL